MEYNKSINAMTPGDEIEGYYILKSANPKVAANGKPFLTGALSDRTGTMELEGLGLYRAADRRRRGHRGQGAGVPWVSIGAPRSSPPRVSVRRPRRIRWMRPPWCPLRPSTAARRWRICAVRPPLRTRTTVPWPRPCWRPTGRRSRPSRRQERTPCLLGGLLMHTANMVKIATSWRECTRDDRPQPAADGGRLLHDMAKAQEFVFSQLGLATDYPLRAAAGAPGRGGSAGRGETAPAWAPEEKSVLLQHLILSHHGEPEFGAAVRPSVRRGGAA